MLKNNLINEFNVKLKEDTSNITDYDIFNNKQELDTIRKEILETLGDLAYVDEDVTKSIILDVINDKTKDINLSNLERSHLYNIIDSEINSYGPLKELLEDDNVEEIMVNKPNEVFISINGKYVKDDSISFINDEHIIRTIKKLLKGTNIILEENKTVTTRINGNAILTYIMPPYVKNPTLTIKKYNNFIANMDELLKIGTLTPYMARFLNAAVLANLNILVIGPSSSGKTSLLNALANLIDDSNRIITIEKVNELNIEKDNIVNLSVLEDEAKLLNTSLLMHPNTIILGRLNDETMFKAIEIMVGRNINVLTTLRASNPLDVVSKIENIGISEHELTSKQVRNMLFNGIDLIVNIDKLNDGRHKITSICEFNVNKNNDIVLKEIFSYRLNDDNEYEFYLSNYKPRAYDKIKEKGLDLVDQIFE